MFVWAVINIVLAKYAALAYFAAIAKMEHY